VGILCWTFFAQSVSVGGTSLLSNKILLEKTQFPRECFPLETMLVNATNTALSLIPLAILFLIYGRAPQLATLWTPVLIVVEVSFAVGVTLAVSGLIIQMRDLAQVLPVVLPLGLFATPVIWPFRYVHQPFHSIYAFFNPIGPVIDDVRRTMLLGNAPDWGPLGLAALGAATYLFVGYKLFKRFEVNFADIA
jgi:ABC-type polysaccharide/polyol phosphate export permease